MMFTSSKKFKQKLLFFIDIHGHSVRRNSFAYGPGIFGSRNIMDVRTLPKMISSHTDMFRYHSCCFRMTDCKKATARAVFSKFAEICYTIETSNWSYTLSNQSGTHDFGIDSWIKVGVGIEAGIATYVRGKC